ncbi:MAG: hypothetical protein KKA32_10320 [Actinobacteria bacterium]|nr:hypothetical protein [Actinomycetota bacterium]
MSDNGLRVAHAFWRTGLQYLDLVQSVAREAVAHKNTWVHIQDYDPDRDVAADYREATRWSDHRIIIPLLFNLLHGIELLAKGFLLAGSKPVAKNHKLPEMVALVRAAFPAEGTINDVFAKYTTEAQMPPLLRDFLTDNRISVDALYQALRYPNPDWESIHRYVELMRKGGAGIPFLSGLDSDIEALTLASVALGRRLEAGSSHG